MRHELPSPIASYMKTRRQQAIVTLQFDDLRTQPPTHATAKTVIPTINVRSRKRQGPECMIERSLCTQSLDYGINPTLS